MGAGSAVYWSVKSGFFPFEPAAGAVHVVEPLELDELLLDELLLLDDEVRTLDADEELMLDELLLDDEVRTLDADEELMLDKLLLLLDEVRALDKEELLRLDDDELVLELPPVTASDATVARPEPPAQKPNEVDPPAALSTAFQPSGVTVTTFPLCV